MPTLLTRRELTSLLLALGPAAGVRAADDGWISLFDGKSLSGWKASEHAASWKVADGSIEAGGPRSHLFYTGPLRNAEFKKL